MAGQFPAGHAALTALAELAHARLAFTQRHRAGLDAGTSSAAAGGSAGANAHGANGHGVNVHNGEGPMIPQPAGAVQNALRRQATEEEEAELATQEEEEALFLGLVEPDEIDMMDFIDPEAEEFDQEKELQDWETAQRDAELAAEAERAENFALQQDMQDVGIDTDRHRLAQIVREGAQWLVDDQAFFQATYAQMAQVQYATQQLLENVHQGMQMAMEIERAANLEEAVRARTEAAIAAETHRMQMAAVKTQANQCKAQMTRLQEALEKEKDRNNCKICFSRTKNAVLLPCLHADYCMQCIAEHRKRRNTCPTCRTPLSGTLECRPAAPDDD
ncbi:hypothetical protein KFL_000740230 [Klebsormidium nitens]|uniref:RING-type domain-containing protein n=1 Tax=Klebsormidium nitens TaxID=105231 RepID=A0A1Y1HSY3_KLENI|nr:hypothetical protein KFL_000740230 [Klebsormidium nitens]|eukprot:GAQ81223.1 hypothetical protein KFL_000740230 [Klebsormidium nitens]